eukprot:2684184-Prorocentrum_lima.AAC.1
MDPTNHRSTKTGTSIVTFTLLPDQNDTQRHNVCGSTYMASCARIRHSVVSFTTNADGLRSCAGRSAC